MMKMIFVISAVMVSVVSAYEYDQYYSADNYPQYVGANYSSLIPQSRFKRTFSSDTPLTFGASLSLKIPVKPLDNDLTMSMPFKWTFPQKARSFSGRSLDGGEDFSEKLNLYKFLENQIGMVTGIDGQACLLRTICEVAVAPEHEDGVLGDALNMVLTVTNTMNSLSHQKSEKDIYVEAQAYGQATADCSPYYAKCPLSIFKLIAK